MSDPQQHTATDVLSAPSVKPVPLKLVVFAGPDRGLELRLQQGTYSVGKSPGNSMTLTDGSVSRTHLMLEVLAAGVRLIDTGSTNGSLCDGRRFSTIEVGAGARITIGRTELVLMPAEGEAEGIVPSERESFGALVGKSIAMRRLFAVLERVAASTADVLLQGETGTGKELCAEAIHAASNRAKKPFVVLDLAAVSANLVESELFGHLRGAFTGAVSDRAGVFESASGGTVFIDEVGELPLELQPRLLRVLERRTVKPLGSNDHRPIDVRVIAATHRDLVAEVAAGRFREDLYHRLAVLSVKVPPLRERPDDIPQLIDLVLSRLGKPEGTISAGSRAMLASYDWPGNVRQLRNAVERAVSLGTDAWLPGGDGERAGRVDAVAVTADRPFKAVKEELVSAFERKYLVDLLKRFDNHISRAAREAGIDRAYLHRLLKKHGLEP